MKKVLLLSMLCASTVLFAQKGDQPVGNQVNASEDGAVQLENDGLRKFGNNQPFRIYTPTNNPGSVTDGSRFQFYDNGIFDLWSTSREGFGFGVNGDGQLEFIANGISTFGGPNTRMVIDDENGNVGIGVLNPQAKLDVIGGDWNLASGSNGDLRIGNDTYNLRIGVATGGGGAGDIRLFANGGTNRLIWGTGTTDHMALNSAGKLGIGMIDASHKVDIHHDTESNDNNAHFNLRTTSDGNFIRFRAENEDGTKYFIQNWDLFGTNPEDYNHIFEFGNSRLLTIRGDGNVGISTNSPDTKLHVVGNENDGTTASLKITSGSQNMLIDGNEIDVTQTGLFLNNNTNLNVVLATGGGNVGIGTATPNNKLDVLGIIRAEEVIVETGWADYVFADNYQLNDLNQVEAFIRENKHLPNVPSAAEIQDKGAHVSALMTKMMEKIEELTLYTIRQQKEIDAMKVQLLNK